MYAGGCVRWPLLWSSAYPWSVKQRIASSHGHLSNRAAAGLVRELLHANLHNIVLAHLSEQCNDAGLALNTIGGALARTRYRGTLAVAPQDRPMDPVIVRPGIQQLALAL